MTKYPIITVIYHETKEHYNIALHTWNSFPDESFIVAVSNKDLEDKGYKYPPSDFRMHYLNNDENCLARAWNKGLKEMFAQGYDYCFVSGLDSISPKDYELDNMIEKVEEVGFVSANNWDMQSNEDIPVAHGDGSFSFYCISKNLFEEVGDFDEGYKPAYFEDDDYLERMWEKGYKPIRMNSVKYYHITQGTIKMGVEIRKEYPKFMQKNLELFKKTYGKVPDHLPKDIKFS